jgi:hypothetical protein
VVVPIAMVRLKPQVEGRTQTVTTLDVGVTRPAGTVDAVDPDKLACGPVCSVAPGLPRVFEAGLAPAPAPAGNIWDAAAGDPLAGAMMLFVPGTMYQSAAFKAAVEFGLYM